MGSSHCELHAVASLNGWSPIYGSVLGSLGGFCMFRQAKLLEQSSGQLSYSFAPVISAFSQGDAADGVLR